MDWDELRSRRPGGGPWGDLSRFKLPNIPLPGLRVALAIVLGIWLATGIYIVRPDERGVVLRFGRMVRTTGPGPHYRLPAPFEQVFKPKVTEVKRLEVGFRTIDPGPPAKYRNMPAESFMLTGDENIVSVEFIVQYRIAEPEKYLFNVRAQELTLRAVAEATIREVVGNRGIDEALTTGKDQIQLDTTLLLQKTLDLYQPGFRVVAVQLQDVHPPEQVIDAFRDVASAREDKNRTINEAEGYKNAIIPETRGKAAEILNQAQGYQEEKIRKARGDAQRFKVVLGQYQNAKDITRKRLYLETMEEILPGMEKFILEDKGVLPVLPLSRERLVPDKK